jgi:hypothetical protein
MFYSSLNAYLLKQREAPEDRFDTCKHITGISYYELADSPLSVRDTPGRAACN